MNSSTYSVKDITKTAMMAAITFIGIYTVKIPSLHGYSHMGDCMIFLSVLILGTRKGALAGGHRRSAVRPSGRLHALGYPDIYH